MTLNVQRSRPSHRVRVSRYVAGRPGPRFLRWQLEQSVEESRAECERHAENLRLLLGVVGRLRLRTRSHS